MQFTIDVTLDTSLVVDVEPSEAKVAQALQEAVSKVFFKAGAQSFHVVSARVSVNEEDK